MREKRSMGEGILNKIYLLWEIKMVNIFRKNKFTYLGIYEGVEIYSEKKYALIFTNENAEETLRVFYKGNEVALALRLTGPVNRIEEVIS